MNVRNVTEEEYKKQYDERLTMKTVLSRIRYYRKPDTKKGQSGPTEEKTVMGYALGASDFIAPRWDPPVTLDNTKTQKISVLTKEGEWMTVNNRGKFSGAHGRLHELKLTKKESSKNWNIATPNPMEEQWRPKQFDGWVDASYLFDAIPVPEDGAFKYQRFCFKGTIATIFGVPDYDTREKAKEEDDEDNMRAVYPINFHGGAPICEVIIDAGNDRRVKAIFGRKKRAEPYVSLPDWDLESCPTIDELRASFVDQTVGIIGQYYKWDTWSDRDSGADILQYSFFAHAIVALSEDQEVAGEEAVDEAKAMKEKLFAAIEAVKKRVGPAGLTADAVRTKMGDDAPEDFLINAAIQKLKETPGGNVPAGDVNKKVYKLIMFESTTMPVTQDYLLIELKKYGVDEVTAEKAIEALLESGEIFEPALGKLQATVNKE